MPGYKRKFKKSRRTSKRSKRYKSVKPKKITALAIAKATQGKRNYLFENRANGHVSGVNQILVSACQDWNDYADNSFVNCARILDAIGVSALGKSNDSEGIKYHISKHRAIHTLRNLTKEPCIVTVYVFKNIVDIYETNVTTPINTLETNFIADLVMGWDLYAPAAAVTLAGTGTSVIYSQGGSYCQLLNDTLHPSNSIGLKKRWKMLNKATRKMAPGDDWILPVHLPSQIYDPQMAEAVAGQVSASAGYRLGTSSIIAYKNMGRVFVVRQHGEIGASDADNTVYGWMQTNLYHGLKETAQVFKLDTVGNSTFLTHTKDTDAADLMSPSMFHMGKIVDDGTIDDA